MEPVTKQMFDLHREHVDQRFDAVEQLVRDEAKHTHPEFATIRQLLGAAATIVGIALVIIGIII